ncbi:MAG: site-specific integrase [Ignavibacteriaceae bacterium]
MECNQKNSRVFPEWNETPKFLDKALRSQNKKVWGWHSLRHRYASILSKQNRPIFELMSLLGHSNISTTQKYLQFLS